MEPSGKRKRLVHMPPELCLATGLNDDMRKDFGLMKMMASETNKGASDRMKSVRDLMRDFKQSEHSKVLRDWGIEIADSKPVEVKSLLLDAGSLIMGNNREINLSRGGNLERETQNEMFDSQQINLQTWAVVTLESKQRETSMFMDNLQKILQQDKIRCKPPAQFKVHRDGEREPGPWVDLLKKTIAQKKDEVQMVVLLLPGRKGDTKFYNPIKNYLECDLGVPSQVVLLNTVSRGKNVLSVVSKIVLQICAKLNKRPWIINGLTFNDKPTMVVGLNITFGKKSSIVMSYSLD